jgi:hypothetical protein
MNKAAAAKATVTVSVARRSIQVGPALLARESVAIPLADEAMCRAGGFVAETIDPAIVRTTASVRDNPARIGLLRHRRIVAWRRCSPTEIRLFRASLLIGVNDGLSSGDKITSRPD